MGKCRRLIRGFLKLIDSESGESGQPKFLTLDWDFLLGGSSGRGRSLQFLEIAIGDVMTAPIRYRVELDTV